MYYQYKALKDNKVTTGKVEANSITDAALFLKRAEYFPIKIWTNESIFTLGISSMLDRVTFSDIVVFTRELAIMLNAGITVIDAVIILKKQNAKPHMMKILDEIERTIREGKPLTSALGKFPQHFSNLYISLVKAGELSGKLNEVLQRLADNLDKQREFRNKIRNMLTYPALVVAGVIIVMFIMVTFVLPQLLELYKSLSVNLPIQTIILIAISTTMTKIWPFLIVAVVLAVIFIRGYLRTPAGQLQMSTLLLNIPIVGRIIQMGVLVDSTRTLSILIGAGVSILEGLTNIVQITSNSVYQKAFQNMHKEIERGYSLGAALKNQDMFPPILVQMATVGEQTGHLDEALMRVSAYFEAESEVAVKTMTTFIEPAILVFLGAGVGLLVYSIITPIYTLTTSIK